MDWAFQNAWFGSITPFDELRTIDHSAQEKMFTFSKAFGRTTVSGGPVGPKSEDAGTTPSLEGPPEAAVPPPAT